MAFTKIQLQSMVSLIRANAEMTREQFYQAIGYPENEVQSLTQSLVDLGQVQENYYDQIAPWVRALSDGQVSFWLDAIYLKYQTTVKELNKAASEQLLLDSWEKSKRQQTKFQELTNEDSEIQEGFVIAKNFYKAQASAIERKLRELGALEPLPDDLQEVP